MGIINKYSKYIPYLYFIVISACMFTVVNKNEGLIAFPILLLGVPFLFQLIKPNQKKSFTLGITFVSLSSYLIIAHLTKIINAATLIFTTTKTITTGWFFVLINFIMALWIIRNSITSKS